jgi:hypothetical protein
MKKRHLHELWKRIKKWQKEAESDRLVAITKDQESFLFDFLTG